MIEFLKKWGVIVAAGVGTLTLSAMLFGYVMVGVIRPAMAEMVAQEREARVADVQKILIAQSESQRDRALILMALQSHNPAEREQYIALMRERWMR